MANPIQRIVQLVLDKNAAKKVETDTKKNLKGIEGGLDSIRKMALKVGTALAAAFGARAIFNFLKDSVKVGAEAQGIWNRLGQAVGNAGVKYEAVEKQIHQTANAMQSATKIGDEEFAQVLTELITTSGNYEESLKNVSLVADLATAKQIDLRSAAQLVGRAMVGQTATLTRYGIVVKQGQDAMEVMRQKFRGFAANEAKTFEGQMVQVNNAWADFKQAIGEALIASSDGNSILERLTRTIKSLTEAVDIFNRAYSGISETAFRNKQAIEQIIATAKTPEKALIGLEMYQKGVQLELDDAQKKLDKMTTKWGTLKGIVSEGDWWSWQTQVESVQETVDGLNETLGVLAQRMHDLKSGKLTVGIQINPNAGGAGGGKINVPSPAPLTQIPSVPGFDTSMAKPKIPEKLSLSPFNAELAKLDHEMEIAHSMASLVGGDYASLDNQAMMLTQTMLELAESGVKPTDVRMQALAERLRDIRKESKLVAKEQKIMAGVANAAGTILQGVFQGNIGPMAKWKAQQNAILAAEEGLEGFIASLNPFTAPLAAGHYAAAAEAAGIAAAWAALAATTGGFSKSTGVSTGGGFGAGRSAVGSASAGASQPGPELNVYFVGEGFDAVNPKVQRIVWGAYQNQLQQAGPNAKVRTFRSPATSTGAP